MLVALGRGGFDQFLGVMLLALFATVALCIGFLMRAPLVASAGTIRHSWIVITAGLIAGSCVISLPTGSLVNHYEMARARRFCDRLRPDLERFRQSNGRYPERLSQILVKDQLPRLLKRTKFYRPVEEGSGYRFSVADRSRLFAGYDFYSRRGTWDYWD